MDTLQALQRDQPRLHLTLDDAGIAAVGRTVTFHTLHPEVASSDNNGSSQHAPIGQGNKDTLDADGAAGDGRSGYPSRDTNRWSGDASAGGAPSRSGSAVAATRRPPSHRIGLDITA
jgi:hypothetical protein